MRRAIASSIPSAGLFICALWYIVPWTRTSPQTSPGIFNIESTSHRDANLNGAASSAEWAHPQQPDDSDRPPRTWRFQSFVSSPAQPPEFSIEHGHGNRSLAEGLIFITPQRRVRSALKGTPYIFAQDGELVYAGDADSRWDHLDFNVQQYKGRPYLTFWRGRRRMNHGYGEVVFLDEQYEEFTVAPVGLMQDIAAEGLLFEVEEETRGAIKKEQDRPGAVDLHELQVTEWNTLLVTAYNQTRYTKFPLREDGETWILDSLFYEVDVHTGEILFRWSAAERVDVRTSHLIRESNMGTKQLPYDFFHISSVEAVGKDYFLVNSRHMWATYMVRRRDGEIEWEIDGVTGGDFGEIPDDGSFRWTHDARVHNFTDDSITISWFDNHAHSHDGSGRSGQSTTPSRGLVMQLSLPPSRGVVPRLLRNTDATTRQRYHSRSQGSYQIDLQYGHQLLCHGSDPVILELDSSGQMLWQARYGSDGRQGQSYRAQKRVWHATPRGWDPKLVLRQVGEGDNRTAAYSSTNAVAATGFVSWNGATDVEAWNVSAGVDEASLLHIGRARKKGFETIFPINVPVAGCVQVGAVQDGREVRKSNVVCL